MLNCICSTNNHSSVCFFMIARDREHKSHGYCWTQLCPTVLRTLVYSPQELLWWHCLQEGQIVLSCSHQLRNSGQLPGTAPDYVTFCLVPSPLIPLVFHLRLSQIYLSSTMSTILVCCSCFRTNGANTFEAYSPNVLTVRGSNIVTRADPSSITADTSSLSVHEGIIPSRHVVRCALVPSPHYQKMKEGRPGSRGQRSPRDCYLEFDTQWSVDTFIASLVTTLLCDLLKSSNLFFLIVDPIDTFLSMSLFINEPVILVISYFLGGLYNRDHFHAGHFLGV